MEAQGISQSHLARRVGVSQATIWKALNGSLPKPEIGKKIAAEFNADWRAWYGVLPVVKLGEHYSFGARLRYLRENRDMSREEMADYLEIPPGDYKQIEAGGKSPSVDVVWKAAGLHPTYDFNWVLSGRTAEEIALEREETPHPEVKIVDPGRAWKSEMKADPSMYFPLPLVAGDVAAGSPRELSEDEIEDWIPSIYHKEWCPHPEQTVCVRVSGDSMEPTIKDKGLVAIDQAQNDPAQLVRKVVAVRADGGVTVKRLFFSEHTGVWIARPDNIDSDEIYTFADADIRDAVIGKIVWIWTGQ